jgi:schlafen family protein
MSYPDAMTPTRNKLMEKARTTSSESKYVDFKREFDVGSTEAWCNVIKDVVAMANSGGGIVVFGLENDGTSCTLDHTTLLAYDTADITNKILKYTNYQFSEIEIVEVARGGKTHAAFLISPTDIPIVFTKPGEYETADKRKKSAFTQGTIYFRHGSKSEPGNRDDLARWREREIVETGPEETVTVISSSAMSPKYGSIVKAAVTNDPTAVRVAPSNAEEIWPYRQVDVIREVNKRLGEKVINPFDITCLKSNLEIFKKHPEYAYKPHSMTSPQYSDAFVEWLVDQHKKNKNFFKKVREEFGALKKK